MQKFELVLFCAIAVHITVITTESGVSIERLDHQGRKLAAQAVDVAILVFYLYAHLPILPLHGIALSPRLTLCCWAPSP